MSVTLDEIACYLDTYLQVGQFQDYCPNGVQVEGKRPIFRLATAVTANLEAIEAVCSNGYDALIVHHGLFWKNDPYPLIGIKKQKIEKLITQGIHLLAYHLPLDAHQEVGNNWVAARDLGFIDLMPFGEAIGVKGSFSPLSVEDFQHRLENYYGRHAQVVLGGKKKISSAALVSGGAYKFISEAAKEKVDAFITGNVDEPAWYGAIEEKINFFALGHHATETVGAKALAKHLQNEFKIVADFIEVKNPF